MKELFNNYYEESFSQNKSQQIDLKTFNLAAKKFRWNYNRFFSELHKDVNILDLGCGTGQFIFFLKECGFENVTGIDISVTQVELARKMQPIADVRFIEDTIEFLKKRQGKYDVVILNDVIEHLELNYTVSLMMMIYFSLKIDGIVIIKTVNSAFPLGSSTRYADLTHKTAYHKKSLIQLLRHIGFQDIKCYQEEIGVYNIFFFLKKIAVTVNRFLLRLMIYFSESDWPEIISVNIIAKGVKK